MNNEIVDENLGLHFKAQKIETLELLRLQDSFLNNEMYHHLMYQQLRYYFNEYHVKLWT